MPLADTDCVEPRKTPRIHQVPPGLPLPSQREYFSANTIVFDVPSEKVAASEARPSQTVSILALLGAVLRLANPPKTRKFPA